MTSLVRRLVLVLTVLCMAVPAAAQEPVAPAFARSEAWFHGTGTAVNNLDAGEGKIPTWDATKPTQSTGSLYAANNLSFLTSGVEHGPGDHFTVKGPVAGELDTMAVTLYAYLPGQAALPCGMDLAFELSIDGAEILFQPQLGASSGMKVEHVSGALYKVKFVFTRLHEAMTQAGVPTGPDVSHAVYLNAMNFYVCQEAVWVYDSATTPAGAIFNGTPEELASYTTVDVFNPPPPNGG